MAMTAQAVPTDPSTVSCRSGFIPEADQAPLQSWIASQHTQTTSRRPAAKLPLSLKDIPYTTAEWKRALTEVKRDYSNKRYRPCSSRCIEILKNVQTTRHYNLASKESKAADEQAFRAIARPVSPSSSLSSLIESCLSRQSSFTRMSSPTPSTASSIEQPLKRKKKVAFADELEQDLCVRPDSPTLGFSDPSSGRASPRQDIPLDPLPPSVQSMPDICPASSPTSSVDGDDSPKELIEEELSNSEERESLERYSAILASIQRQITSHLSAIDREITAVLSSKPSVPADAETRALELHSRIERLRANGWKRKRFDAQRYEEFREQVMSDMSSCYDIPVAGDGNFAGNLG
ncbi:hypothetical protein LLEC1_02272 [Akanthomyces lecanii]|uniref:Uncharacterized protein n=1 Tax=Cordyceps confragosa TaxID=2714763 RepID=A0A179IA85_CORDF|nr:hypothetical protein LLEC1_02272 [Akanthomyces lecanii]